MNRVLRGHLCKTAPYLEDAAGGGESEEVPSGLEQLIGRLNLSACVPRNSNSR